MSVHEWFVIFEYQRMHMDVNALLLLSIYFICIILAVLVFQQCSLYSLHGPTYYIYIFNLDYPPWTVPVKTCQIYVKSSPFLRQDKFLSYPLVTLAGENWIKLVKGLTKI